MARRLPEVDRKSLELYVRRMAIVLDDRGKPAEAEPLYHESLELSRSVYGEEHPRVAMALDNLAIFFDGRGDYERAEPLYRESLAMLRRVYGEQHPEVAQTMGNLASFLIYTKGPSDGGSKADLEEAEVLLHQALEINRQFRPDHFFTGDVFADFGELRLREANHVEAEHRIREALRIYRLKLPEEHSKIAKSKRQLGEVLFALGRLEEAEPLLLDVHEALKAEEREDGELAQVVAKLVELYDALGKPEEAAEYRALLEETEKAQQ